MFNATEAIPIEMPQHCAETIGTVSDQISDLPCIVPVDPPAGWMAQWAWWSRALVSVGVSLLGHVGVLAWLGYLPGSCLTRLIPVQEGHAAIELTASVVSTAQSSPNETESVEFETALRPKTRSAPAPAPTLPVTATPVGIPRPVNGDLAPVADGPEAEAPFRYEPPVHPERIQRKQLAPEATLSAPERESLIARTRVERQPSGDVLAEPIEQHASDASMPSPASRAADGADSVPALVYNPAPSYPADALKRRQAGRVVLSVRIAPDGSVAAAEVHRSSGVPSLDRAALEAVRQWRFEPSESASAPMRQAAVPIRFVIAEPDRQGN